MVKSIDTLGYFCERHRRPRVWLMIGKGEFLGLDFLGVVTVYFKKANKTTCKIAQLHKYCCPQFWGRALTFVQARLKPGMVLTFTSKVPPNGAMVQRFVARGRKIVGGRGRCCKQTYQKWLLGKNEMRGDLYIKLDGSLHIVVFISLFQDSAAPLRNFKQSLIWFSELNFSLVPDVETWISVPPFLGRFTDVWVCLKIGWNFHLLSQRPHAWIRWNGGLTWLNQTRQGISHGVCSFTSTFIHCWSNFSFIFSSKFG